MIVQRNDFFDQFGMDGQDAGGCFCAFPLSAKFDLSPTRVYRVHVRILLVGIKEAFEGLVQHIGSLGPAGLVGLVVSEAAFVATRYRGRERMLLLRALLFGGGLLGHGQLLDGTRLSLLLILIQGPDGFFFVIWVDIHT